MGRNRFWLIALLSATLAHAFSATSHAGWAQFTVDTTGGSTGLTPIANTTGNIGNYAAGSWLKLSGSATGAINGIDYSGNLTAQKASSGAFSTGNPGSLTSYYTGTGNGDLNSPLSNKFDIDWYSLFANSYNGHYPEVGGANIGISPGIGGGPSAASPGSAPADYGANISLKALGGLVTVANGTVALRDFGLDVHPTSPLPLSGPLSAQTFDTNNKIELGLFGNLDYNLKGGVLLGNTVPDMIGSVDLSDTPFAFTTGGPGIIDTYFQTTNLVLFRMTLPIEATFVQTIPGVNPLTVTFTLSGQIATEGVINSPEPSTFVILGSAAIPIGLAMWRRRRRVMVG
jgi:hypothetical protein